MSVSVIVPVYKVRDYLEKCLDSVIMQTMRDLDIILIDDDSYVSTNIRFYLILVSSQIIQIGRMKVFLSMAEISSRKHRIAPAPLGTEPLSSTLKADASSVPGFVLFLISSG